MDILTDGFWNATLEEWKQGYVYDMDRETYTCLVCGETFEQGRIYPIEEAFYDAKKAVEYHVHDNHESMFHVLLDLDKEYTGFTDHQKNLLKYFYNGYSDKEIIAQIGGSASTIRNYRFNFREKEKQAKLLLAILELLREGTQKKDKFVHFHRTAKMMDERYAITDEEYEKVLNMYFPEGLDGKLSLFPKKEKRKLIILRHLSKRFELNRTYTEKEVNEVLLQAYDDYVTLRRYLIDYGFLERKEDGSAYWLKK
ncbi:DUF2087 domain-containing protein [Brevibacillus ginsengisoli]|uniref:DUF2087 domain-containing protein n=1 Tax=Brevibacillus ginsengisoli TaxID=363854 RepID=UPI003CE6DB43